MPRRRVRPSMDDDPDRKRAAAERFAERAAGYVDSDVHRGGDDLGTLAEWCDGATRALDVATGTGHAAGALLAAGVPAVVAADAAPGMVRTAEREYPGVRGVVADAECLPFRDGAFDAVTCRIAAHHFPNPPAFVDEVARVLAPGGVLAFEDNVAPAGDALDRFLNAVERLRDPTHVRSHRASAWTEWLSAAGLVVEATRRLKRTLDYRDWVATQEPPAANRRELERLFADPAAGANELFEIRHDDGRVASFANLKLLLRARRPDR